MKTANTKLAVACLLAMMVACQCLVRAPAESPGGSRPIPEDVKVTEVTNGLNMCKSRTCSLIKQSAIDERAQQFPDAFQSEGDLKQRLSTGSANATSCSVFGVQLSSQQCPRCTADDRDQCCATCRYYSRVPYVLPGNCYAISFKGRYQYTQNGICKSPNKKCGTWWWTLWNKNKCKQTYSWSTAVCLKVTWPSWYLTVQWFRHPAYCSCRYSPMVDFPSDSKLTHDG